MKSFRSRALLYIAVALMGGAQAQPAGGPPHDREGQGPGGKPPVDQPKK